MTIVNFVVYDTKDITDMTYLFHHLSNNSYDTCFGPIAKSVEEANKIRTEYYGEGQESRYKIFKVTAELVEE